MKVMTVLTSYQKAAMDSKYWTMGSH